MINHLWKIDIVGMRVKKKVVVFVIKSSHVVVRSVEYRRHVSVRLDTCSYTYYLIPPIYIYYPHCQMYLLPVLC